MRLGPRPESFVLSREAARLNTNGPEAVSRGLLGICDDLRSCDC